MSSLHLVTDWPVDHVAAALVRPGDSSTVDTIGDTERVYRLASLSKCLTGWAAMIAWEEGIIELDSEIEHPGAVGQAHQRRLLRQGEGDETGDEFRCF